jgi:hypothetical protein
MNRDRTSRENGGEGRHSDQEGTTRTAETAQRARGFFERAGERIRNAARELGQRARGMERERGRGYEDRDEGWFGRHEGERMMNRGMGRERDYGMRERDWERARYGRGREDERGTMREPMLDWRDWDRDRDAYGGYGGSQYMRGDERDRDRDEDRWDREDRQNRDRRW